MLGNFIYYLLLSIPYLGFTSNAEDICKTSVLLVCVTSSDQFSEIAGIRTVVHLQAVELLDKDHSPRVIVDVLRTASKACVVKGLFQKAKLLIQEAVLLAKEVYGSECHPKYADCLMDLGFYLQNSDGASASVQAYEKALAVS